MSTVPTSPAQMEPRHLPVMPQEVLTWLNPLPGQIIVDATVGGGGHARLLAERLGPTGRLIGLDRDASMLDLARPHIIGCPVTLMHANFDQLGQVLDEMGIDRVDGVLGDLGFASDQMDRADRGFSFQQEGPLDMRLDRTERTTAADLVAGLSARELADIFWLYGEERLSRRIAHRIVQARHRQPIGTTTQLAELVRRVARRSGKIDPATRVFQALRIAVNDELASLDRLLALLPHVLKPEGRAVIIAFHSLEDRRVKNAFRNRECWQVLTRKPVTASEAETRTNPRSRSAKLRAARLLEIGARSGRDGVTV
jgi:16S rRNA (cytosine1402-N4)-methyltransferase